MSDAHAVWTVAPYEVRIHTESLAPLNADEVAISTHYSAISHGTEMLVYRGQVPGSMALDLPTLEGSFAFPIKYGYAVVGRVQDIGTAVVDVAIGDMVFALHPHQTYCHVHHTLVKKIPPTIPAKAAVLAANMETAINIVHDTRPVLGDIVVVVGLGVVGLLVSWLLARQAVRVIAIDPIAHRRECAQQLGVLKVIHPDDVAEFVQEITEGRGADCVIEVSGNPKALPLALDLVGQEGLIVVASWYGNKPVTLDLGSRFHRGRVRMRSSQVGQLSPDLAPRWDYQRRMGVVWRMLAQFPYHVVISHEYRFENAAVAYEAIDHGELPMVQTVLQYAIAKG
jgi:2-desacetyl-2-hydroxyethyl bacteriochlorophyllide A dehydrogenase